MHIINIFSLFVSEGAILILKRKYIDIYVLR